MLVLGKQFPAQPSPAMERGITIHKSLEDYLNGGELPTYPKFESALIKLREQNASAELQWGLNSDWTPCNDFQNAWGKCVIDAFVKTPDYLLIVDFKTGKPSPISHQDQAQTYAIAAHCYYPNIEEIHAQFWYLDIGTTTQCSFKKEHTDHYKKVLHARIDRMLNDTELRPKPNQYVCKWCNYQDHCEFKC